MFEVGHSGPAVNFYVPSCHGRAPRPVTRGDERRIARQFLDELLSHRLEVCLTRAPDAHHMGHMVRLVCSQNPEWYRRFTSMYSSSRKDRLRWSKHKTLIKRRETVRGLERILRGGAGETPYTERLRDFIRRYGRGYYRR